LPQFTMTLGGQMNAMLKRHRLNKGMTQKELAKRLGYTSPQFVSNWERDLCRPPLDVAAKLCRLLDIDRGLYKKELLKEYDREVSAALKAKQ